MWILLWLKIIGLICIKPSAAAKELKAMSGGQLSLGEGRNPWWEKLHSLLWSEEGRESLTTIWEWLWRLQWPSARKAEMTYWSIQNALTCHGDPCLYSWDLKTSWPHKTLSGSQWMCKVSEKTPARDQALAGCSRTIQICVLHSKVKLNDLAPINVFVNGLNLKLSGRRSLDVRPSI